MSRFSFRRFPAVLRKEWIQIRRDPFTLRMMVRSKPAVPPFQFELHARYNPEQLTVLNIVPGLICIVLTISALFVTTLSITRETERGTVAPLQQDPSLR